MEFVALDVETANPDMASLCQIGIAKYKDGKLLEEWETLVNPNDYFDEVNITIHGITPEAVKNAPSLIEIYKHIQDFLNDRIVICHTHFDRVAMGQAFDKNGLVHPACTWLDTARVARRTWEDFAWRGYGLENICKFIGYTYSAHDALEDAKAAAHVLITAMQKTGLDLQNWLERVEQPIGTKNIASKNTLIAQNGNPEGSLYGEVIVFTGSLKLPRCVAAQKAALIGCKIGLNVTKDTTILVVGDQDVRHLAGHDKSSKHRKAEKLIREGQQIRILRETDFEELLSTVPNILTEGSHFEQIQSPEHSK